VGKKLLTGFINNVIPCRDGKKKKREKKKRKKLRDEKSKRNQIKKE